MKFKKGDIVICSEWDELSYYHYRLGGNPQIFHADGLVINSNLNVFEYFGYDRYDVYEVIETHPNYHNKGDDIIDIMIGDAKFRMEEEFFISLYEYREKELVKI